MADTLQWTQLHLDYLRCIKVSQVRCTCREACTLARISCHVGQVPKWHQKALVSCLADSFIVLKYHMIQTIQMCCTGVSVFIAASIFIGIMLEDGVLQNVIWSNKTDSQWCMGVANNYSCYCQLYRLAPYFYSCSTLYHFLILGKILVTIVSTQPVEQGKVKGLSSREAARGHVTINALMQTAKC